MLKLINKFIILIFLFPVKLYQWFISPLLPQSCRHVPTCSNYAISALKTHGIIKGTWLSVRRISKCHPWGTTGYDPVPGKGYKVFKFKKYN